MSVIKHLVLSLAVVGPFAGVARASPIVVYETRAPESVSMQAKFDADPSLGRAWIAVETDDWQFQPQRTTLKERVVGLSYDQESGDVVFQAKGQEPVVCATKSSLLGMSRYEATGNCSLAISYETLNVDDGTDPENQRFAKVTIDPTPGASTAATGGGPHRLHHFWAPNPYARDSVA